MHVITSEIEASALAESEDWETVAWTPGQSETLVQQALWDIAGNMPTAGVPSKGSQRSAGHPSIAKVAASKSKRRRKKGGHARRQQKAVAKAAAAAAADEAEGRVRRSKKASYSWSELLELASL